VFPIRAETQEGLTNLLVSQFLYDLPDDYLQTYRDQVSSITADDVLDAARKYVQPDSMAIVIVGDAEEVLAQARGYAEDVEVFDTEKVPKDPAAYNSSAASGDAANVAGDWVLTIDLQGQTFPVTMNLSQTDASVTGTVTTMMGEAKIIEGRVRGRKLSATASAEFQGQVMELAISGTLDGESMQGTISAPIVPEPLSFTGERTG
jgi:zinc protease